MPYNNIYENGFSPTHMAHNPYLGHPFPWLNGLDLPLNEFIEKNTTES